MEYVSQFPFVNLSMELALIILAFAAQPAFQSEVESNPYSSALALCQVSSITRRAVLPQLLRTVLLSKDNNVTSFVHALRMQKLYRQQGHRLHFEYAAHIHSIWIGEICVPPPVAPLQGEFSPNTPVRDTAETDIDFSVLAPVILSASSLAIDFASLFLLCGCLEHAWSTHTSINAHPECCLPPWSVKSLTFSGEFTRWLPLTSTAEGSAFLASISHLMFLSLTRSTPTTVCRCDPCLDYVRHLDYSLPEWMTSVPWVALKSIQAVSLPFWHTVLPPGREVVKFDYHIELLTLFGSMGHNEGHYDWVPKRLSGSIKDGEGHISRVDVRLSRSQSSDISFFDVRFAWEEAWACGVCK